MRKPVRARATTATPTRRDLVAALAAAGILAVLPRDARAEGAGEAGEGTALPAIPEGKGRVVLAIYSSPASIRLSVDGVELAQVEVMTVPSASAPADAGADGAPSMARSIDDGGSAPNPPPPAIDGAMRIAFDVAPGLHSITVHSLTQAPVTVAVMVDAGKEALATIYPAPAMAREVLGGVPPVEPHHGCCGGVHAPLASNKENAPALGATAAAVLTLLLRRRSV